MRISWLLLVLFFVGCSTAAVEDRNPAAAPGAKPPVPRDALQKVMEGCVATADPRALKEPCVQMDRSQGVERGALLIKDEKSKTHFLLVPTSPAPRIVTGIEDPKLLATGAPNYWLSAWSVRDHVAAALGKKVPDQMIGFAANPPFQRTQDILHIHIDCAQPDVVAALKALQPRLTQAWSQPIALHGRPYHIAFVRAELRDFNPFILLARSLAKGDAMGFHTLGVFESDPADMKNHGFFVVEAAGKPPLQQGQRVHAEDLLDPGCSGIR